MAKPTRRSFLKTAGIVAGTGLVSATVRAEDQPASPAVISGKKLNVACVGVGGKGDSDSNNAAKFGNIVAICDVDRGRLDGKGKKEGFQSAKKYTDFREMLEKHKDEIDIVTVSTPDHNHAAATLLAMRLGKHVYTQKPLTRTIYEARKLRDVAAETGVCTQMGNQGRSQATSRTATAQIKAGVIGTVTKVIVWSNRPVWAQKPGRRDNLEKYAAAGYTKDKDRKSADQLIWSKFAEVQRGLESLDWKNWIGTAKYRDYFPGLYHSFQWRGWWDFGSGALGDMACHQVTVPFLAADLKDPTWVRAKSSGHDFDSFPESSIIEFEFPSNSERGKIPFWWYDRKGNKPPKEEWDGYGIEKLADSGVLIFGEKGVFYSSDDYCGRYELRAKGGAKIEPLPNVKVDFAVEKGDMDTNQMYELFRAIEEKKPGICGSNFLDLGGPLTETILLGNLAVWATKGGQDDSMGDWGEKIEWDAKNLKVTNLSSLKTPGVQELVKPTYTAGYVLD